MTKSIAALDRLLAKIRETPSGCWEWTAGRNRANYGTFSLYGQNYLAHRASYELLVAEIPAGLQIDHLCRNRACVNPQHLEPVTPRENTLRGIGLAGLAAAQTHCKNGHPFDAENTQRVDGVPRAGRRRCLTCRRATNIRNKRAARARIKAAATST